MEQKKGNKFTAVTKQQKFITRPNMTNLVDKFHMQIEIIKKTIAKNTT